MAPHRNPKAKPYKKQKTGNERRGNPDASRQARENLRKTAETIKNNVPKIIKNIRGDGSNPSISSPNVPVKTNYTPTKVQKPPVVNPKLPSIPNIPSGQVYNKLASSPYRSSENLDYIDIIKKKRKRDREYRKSLPGQIEAEIESFTTTGKNTRKYKFYSKVLNTYWNDYIYNVDQEELRKWYNDNIISEKRFNIESGQYETVETIKEGAPPPPLSTDSNGNTIDISAAWEYCQAYDKAINEYIDDQNRAIEEGTATKYAGQDESPDSLLDVFRAAVNPDESGPETFKTYVRDYIWNPFINGDFKALGINTLWNLGETLDFFATGARAVVASNDIIGSKDSRYDRNGREVTFKGQNEWYYDDNKKEIQTKLVNLGADKLLTGAVRSESDYNTGGSEHHKFRNTESKEDIISRIKRAGLWEQYLEMKSAWAKHQQDFRDENRILKYVKSAYTDTTADFHADTGNLAKDIAIEVALDPTLILGGAARGFAKTSARATSEIAARSAIKNFVVPEITEESRKAAEKSIKQFVKNNGSNLLTKNHNQISEDVKHLGTMLERNGVIDEFSVPSFNKSLTQEIFASVDSINYMVVRSLHNASELMDKADSALLKSVFAIPYFPISGAIRSYRGARSEISRLVSTAQHRADLFGEAVPWLPRQLNKAIDNMAKNNQLDEIIARNQFGKMQSLARLPKETTLGDIQKFYDEMANQPSSEVWDEADVFIQSAQDLVSSLNKPLADFRDGKLTASEYGRAVDAQIETLSGVATTRSELKVYLEDLYKNAPEGDYGRIGKIYDEVMGQLRQIESVEKQLLDREVESLSKELKKIKTVPDLIEFSNKYFIRNAESALPEAFEEALLAKRAELGGELTTEDFDMVVRNLERNRNITTDLNPRDADIPLPASVKDSKGFSTTIPDYLTKDVKKLQRYFVHEDHDWRGLVSVRRFMFSIRNVDNMPPKALHDVLNKGINQLMIRQSMGLFIDDELYELMINVDQGLRNDALSIDNVVGKNVEYNAMHLDHLTVFDEYMKNPQFQKVLETLRNPETKIGKALRDVKRAHLSGVEYENNPVYEMLMQINNLLDMNKHFFEFRNKIADEVAGLTDRQVYAVLDRLFGITKGSPTNYLNKAMRAPEKFMEDLETLLVAEYGEVRCSLDGARTQINTFDEDLFSRYSNEIEDPDIQARLRAIAQPGHIDPMNDVRVQMLYTILRDDTTIKDYNALQANEREVIFSDIETSGLNRDRNGLTSIAFKKWVPIPEDAKLSDILDVIESKESETLFKRSLSEDELKRIDDGLLNSLFAKDPKIANTSREVKLEAYRKFYAEEADGTKIFSSEEDMMKFINQYITDSSVTKETKGHLRKRTVVTERAVPCLVFHNANGFDTKFLTARMRNLKVGIPKGAVKHLSDIETYSHNTLARLRALEDDVILTYEQKQFVLDNVIDLAHKIESYNNGFKFLDPRALDIALYNLRRVTRQGDFSPIPKTDKNTIKPSDVDVDKYPKDSLEANLGVPNSDKFTSELGVELNSEELKSVVEDLKFACQEVGHMQNRYERHIIQKVGQLDDDFATAKTYSNLMREAQATVPDRPWSYLSYNVLFRSSESSKFFDWSSAKKMAIDDLHNMKQLTDWVNHKMQYNLRAGADEIIEPYEEFFRDVIDTAIHFVQDVDRYNKFSYLRFLKQPSTPMEAFLVAQKLYDDVLKYADPNMFDDDSVKRLTQQFAKGELKNRDFTKFMQVQFMMKDGLLAGFVDNESAEALEILSGKRYIAQIFNNEFGDVPHYIESFRTPQQRAVAEIKELRSNITNRTTSFMHQSSFFNSSDFANIKTARIQTAFDHINNILEIFRIEETSSDFWSAYVHFKNALNAKRMELFDAYRLNRMLRDVEGKVCTDEQLISEVLFTNGLRKVIPRTGNELHVTQVNELIDRVQSMDSHYLVLHEEGDHVVISINPSYKPTFIRNDDNELVARFTDSSTEYKLMEEDKLGFPTFEEVMRDYKGIFSDERDLHYLQDVYKELQKVYDDLDDITDGASRGTLGITASYNKELKLASSFSTKTIRESLRTDYTGDARIWGHDSFDKSLLGDFENSWKLNSSSDDFDMLLSLANTLDEASGKVMSERHYIDTFFGKASPCKVSSLGNHFTNDELLEAFKTTDDYVCVTLHAADTETGFEVRQIDLKDTLSVEFAKRNDAIYVPYDLYLDMADVINTSDISNKALKLWSKFAAALKVTQLVHPGTFIRNWIDATYKLAADEGSLGMALGYEFIAAKRLMQAQKIIREAGTDITEAMWRSSNYDRYMTYDDFKDLIGFKANDTVSGGEASRAKRILNEYFEKGRKDEALGINGYDTIGKDVQRFEQAYDVDKLTKLLQKLKQEEPNVFDKLSEEEFITIFNIRKVDDNFKFPDDSSKWYYNDIASKAIDIATNNIRHPIKESRRNFDRAVGWMLTPMSQTELIVRYSQLLALRDLGYTNASAYKHIIDTHFNYNNKSMRMKCLEAVVPFATFQYNNLLYWIRQIDNDPRMIRWIEQTFGAASFDGIEDVVTEDDEDKVDQSLEYRIASGGIPLGSGGLYFKLNPSYLDAMNWFYGGPDDFLSKVSPPIRTLANATIETMGFDSFKMFSETQFSHSAQEWGYELAESIPGANLISGYVRHYKERQPWTRVDEPLQQVLVGALPSLFGAVKAYDRSFNGDFNEWQKELAEDGKWYDAQKGKVVDISEYNTDGLNNPELYEEGNFDRLRILQYLTKGRLYDQNQRKFVTPDKFIYGGLNRDWDFSKEGEWEEYCDLKKKYFGLEYDMNCREFVYSKSEGGLNSDDLDWDKICDLNEELGIYWDSNQCRFVEKEYLTEGGFNREELSFSELCAYEYAMRGKIWDRNKEDFVDAGVEPIITTKAYNKYNDWAIFNNLGFNPMNLTSDNSVYYDENGMLRSVDGKYVLSNDQVSNNKIFNEIVALYSAPSYTRRFGYHNGWGGEHYYKKQPIVPSKPYRNNKQNNKPFNFVNNTSSAQAELRMSLAGYRSYNAYYQHEYSYNYSYRTPKRVSGIKRFDFYRPDNLAVFNKFAYYSR